MLLFLLYSMRPEELSRICHRRYNDLRFPISHGKSQVKLTPLTKLVLAIHLRFVIKPHRPTHCQLAATSLKPESHSSSSRPSCSMIISFHFVTYKRPLKRLKYTHAIYQYATCCMLHGEEATAPMSRLNIPSLFLYRQIGILCEGHLNEHKFVTFMQTSRLFCE